MFTMAVYHLVKALNTQTHISVFVLTSTFSPPYNRLDGQSLRETPQAPQHLQEPPDARQQGRAHNSLDHSARRRERIRGIDRKGVDDHARGVFVMKEWVRRA